MLKVFVGRMKRKPLFMPFDLHEVMAFTTYSVFELNCPLECLHELLVHQTIMLVFVFTLLKYVFTTILSTYHIIVFRCYHHLSIFRVWNLYWDFLEAVQRLVVIWKLGLFLAVSPLFWWYFLIAEFPPLTLLNVL